MQGSRRVILITGASSGIGAALALRYARSGITLHLAGRNRERLEAVAARCREAGADALPVVINVERRSDMLAWLRQINAGETVDLAIANAGISQTVSISDPDAFLDDLDLTVGINLIGAANTIYPLIPGMRERRAGHLVLVGSLAGWRGFPHAPNYCATKAGLRSLAEGLRPTLEPEGVRVTLVEPGFVKTPMSDRLNTPKPFQLSVERGAEIIHRGVEANRAEIAFPLPLALLERLLLAMPPRLSDWLIQRFG
jgi:NAD(P)-dependent dehydrogenase (short-subunit alcohol dehydrogenase family)